MIAACLTKVELVSKLTEKQMLWLWLCLTLIREAREQIMDCTATLRHWRPSWVSSSEANQRSGEIDQYKRWNNIWEFGVSQLLVACRNFYGMTGPFIPGGAQTEAGSPRWWPTIIHFVSYWNWWQVFNAGVPYISLSVSQKCGGEEIWPKQHMDFVWYSRIDSRRRSHFHLVYLTYQNKHGIVSTDLQNLKFNYFNFISSVCLLFSYRIYVV